LESELRIDVKVTTQLTTGISICSLLMFRRYQMKLPLRSSIVAVFAVTAILCVGVATAQVSKGSISGTVVDPSGADVVGAQVKATSTFTSQAFTTTSDSSGSFRLNQLPVGVYRVEVTKEAFRTTSLQDVGVSSNADSGLGSIKLELGAAAETVEVIGGTPLVETTQAQVTATFTAQEMANLPGVQENEGLDNLALCFRA
jgi:hypothetical protein